jgi:benzylsuccinate CoA-transferase BbsF subunit
MFANFLTGIRFADLTWAGAGPFSTKIFSDFGAEVIKVESASRPDPVRVGGPYKDGVFGLNRSGYFASRNTGKQSFGIQEPEHHVRPDPHVGCGHQQFRPGCDGSARPGL